MRPLPQLHGALRRSPRRRAFAYHRPPARRRNRRELRGSDIVLALLGLTLLGAACLVAAVNLVGQALTP